MTSAMPATIRALTQQDLDAVVAIDALTEGHARRTYMQRRVTAALKQPELHVQLAAVDAKGLAGYVLARRTVGEFGRPQQGIGKMLMDALAGYGSRHEVGELRTTAAWNQHAMLRWLESVGFALSPDRIVHCAVGDGYQAERDDALQLGANEGPGHEVDYGTPEGNDFDRVERSHCDVRSMRPEDLPQILRIDRHITGRDREAYIAGKLGEAMDDSAIRVSLTARLEDSIVGFLMARADLGDFGRAEPVAVLDTIGVDPAYAHRGVGHALVGALFSNLGALQIDRVETVVAPRDLALLGFLYDVGFEPSPRLSFLRKL